MGKSWDSEKIQENHDRQKESLRKTLRKLENIGQNLIKLWKKMNVMLHVTF
jgi:hypothetical protein